LTVGVVVFVAAGGLVVAGPGRASPVGGAARPTPSPALVAEIEDAVQRSIADEDEALAAVYAGEKGSALLAIGKGMRDLRHADDLNGGEGNHDSASYSAGLKISQVIVDDYLVRAIIETYGTPPPKRREETELRRREVILLNEALTYKRGALAIFQAIDGNESAPPGTVSTERPAQSCVDVLRSTAGMDAYFAVDDSQDAHDPAAVAFSTPSGVQHTIPLTLDSNGLGGGEYQLPPATGFEITVKVTPRTLPSQTVTYSVRGDGKPYCKSLRIAPSTTTAPTPSKPTSTTAAPTGVVIIAGHELGWAQTTPDICKGGTITLRLTLEGIPPDTQVKLQLTGSGLEPTLTLTLDPGFEVTHDFTVPASKGPVSWTSQIVSIGGKPPPTSGAHVAAFAACPTTP
jgi:hypothetical protein